MKIAAALAALGLALLTGCAPAGEAASSQVEPITQVESEAPSREGGEVSMARESGPFTADTPLADVKNDPVFGDYGRLLFPVEDWYTSGTTLGELQLTWYSNIDPEETVEIVNTLWQRVSSGETVFYDIYTDEEKAADPEKEDTGLFFFKGEPGEKFAVCNAGGGFAYVGAMQDSFPHALELSKRGYPGLGHGFGLGTGTVAEGWLDQAAAFWEEQMAT